MKVEWTKFLPPGVDGKSQKKTLITGLVVTLLGSSFFLIRYSNAYSHLYMWNNARTEKIFIEGAMMEPFSELIDGLLVGFPILAVGMLGYAIYHYMYHHQESKSIYLMRRLPDRWELHRRCLTVPLVSAAVCLICGLVVLGLYYGIYIILTPAQYLP